MFGSPSTLHIRRAVEPSEEITAEEALRRARAAHERMHPKPQPARFVRREEVAEAQPQPASPFVEMPGMATTVRFLGFCAAEPLNVPKITTRDIIEVTAEHYGISRMDVISDRRTKRVVVPRQVAMYLCRMLTPLSLPHIGARFNGRDHTTVMHGIARVTEMISDPDIGIARDIEAIKHKLGVTE